MFVGLACYNRAMSARGPLRNFVFGAEDSLVSTVGLLSGVSFAGLASREIILSGVILILVEAISMGAGVYISETSANELPGANSTRDNQRLDSIIMLISYLIIGLIPLAPYLFLVPRLAFSWSIILSLVALFMVGYYQGLTVGRSPLRAAVRISMVGAVVIAVAMTVGFLLKVAS